MTTEAKPLRKNAPKVIIIHVPEARCIGRILTDQGNHELVTDEVGRPGYSKLITLCLYCGLSWGDLDAALNPTATGRKL